MTKEQENTPLRLFLDLEGEEARRYTEALKRVRGVVVVESDSSAEAVISTRGDGHSLPLLWLPPVEEDEAEKGGEPAHEDRVMPAAEWRFQQSIRVMADRLRQGKLGEPGVLRIHRWTEKARLLADLDLASWLFGGVPETLYAVSRFGYVQCHLGFCEGGMALIDHAAGGHFGDGYESVTLIGGKGAGYADDHRNVNLRFDETGCQGMRVTEGDTGLVDMLRAFAGAVKEERGFAVTMEDWHRAREIGRRVKKSLDEGAAA